MAREKICGIYVIKNNINEKCYVGQSVDIYHRWTQHKDLLKKCKHHNAELQADWNKYGVTAFSFEILEKCDESKLDLYETRYISELNTFWNGYNMDFGGRHDILYTDSMSVDEKLKIHEKRRSTKSACSKSIVQIDLNGNIVAKWPSIKSAAKVTGYSSGTISRCSNNEAINKSYKGYIWVYEEDYCAGFDISPYINLTNTHPKVVQYSIDGNIVATYDSLYVIDQLTDFTSTAVRLCCQGKRPHHKGFIWRYEGDSFDKYEIPKLEHKRICQLNFDGNILTIFENRKDAANAVCANTSEIDRSARTGSICRGFLWKKLTEKEINDIAANPRLRCFAKYDNNGVLLKAYASFDECVADYAVSQHSYIYNCLNGKQDYAYGYKWKYIGDQEYEKYYRACRSTN